MTRSKPPPQPKTDVRRLAQLIGRFMEQVNRRGGGTTLAIIHEAGLTLPQMVTMHILRARGTMDLGSITEGIRLTASSTSHLVDRLVERGYVDRWENPDDRRQKLLRLTDSGREVVDLIARSRADEMTAVMAELSPELQRQLADTFEIVLAQMEEERAQ